MDPTAALAELRNLIDQLSRVADASDDAGERWYLARPLIYETVTTFESLDEWMTRGGFKPADWA